MQTEATFTDEDIDDIWGSVEAAAAELDGKVVETSASGNEVGVVLEKNDPPADPGPAPKELEPSLLSQAAGAVGHKPPKEGGSYVVYESDHNFQRYEYHSTGECKIWDGDNYVSSFNYLDENDERSPYGQALCHAANLRLGINRGFQIDTFQKLDWYHAKRVTVAAEIETVKEALKAHIRLLENDEKRLEELEGMAAEFAATLLKGKAKNVKMTHGTINFTDKSESCVLDEQAAEARAEHIAKLYQDEEYRTAYGIEEIKTYKQDSAKIAKEELAHFQEFLKDAKPNEDGEVPQYQPLHPGWKIKPAHRAVYFRTPKEK